MDRYVTQAGEKLLAMDRLGFVHEDTVCALLQLIRQHLDANDLKKKYAVLNFYCNWVLHVGLSNEVVQNKILEIDDIGSTPLNRGGRRT